MQIIEKSLKVIKPYENNPRFNGDAVEPLMKSIKEFGFLVPIVIDNNNVIVAGHTRFKAAQKLGLKTIPCVIASDLTTEQINAYRLADNKIAELSTWDFDLLNIELEKIIDFDMSDLGFDLSFEPATAFTSEQAEEFESIDNVEDEDYDAEADYEDDTQVKQCVCPSCGCRINVMI